MKTTRYFREQILQKRPYLSERLCRRALDDALVRQVQSDGRIRHWAMIVDDRDGQRRALRIVTLDDGETIHNAFFDRNFRETDP